MAGGGPIESITIDGRRFAVDAESNMDLSIGGFNNEVKPNGDGSTKVIKSRVPAMAKGGALSVDNDRNDLKFLQDVANKSSLVPVDVTLTSGDVYSGAMQIVGEINYKTMDGTCELEMAGTVLDKQ